MQRRDVLKQIAALGVVSRMAPLSADTDLSTVASAEVDASALRQEGADKAPNTLKYFPGFKPFRVKTSGAEVNGVIGGSGPPVLLLHGAPQTHITWRMVAPKLAATRTVVAADLRGYGDSSKPADGENHVNYSKRAMALDQVEVMKHFGFDKFPVIGQDRGGRVTHRLALDHPERVTRAAVLDIVPTHYLYTHVTIDFVQAYFHWFNYLRAAPLPENELKAQNDAAKARASGEIQLEYLRTASDPANIHAMCEDYRAGASIDLQHDGADFGKKKIACPLRVLWAEKGAMGRIYDVMKIWRDYGSNISGRPLPGGHNLQEDVPDLVLAEITDLIKGA
ncbi:MAG TPA: alpha/beta hydrolase [Vicinamibacterales bacterium]|nr:alpha/beta hydrolase [Vicinamibacterales bacterium]